MKEKTLLVSLMALGLILTGCNENDGGSSSSSEPSDDTSSSEPIVNDWSEADKALMNTYCGSPLPYPSSYVTGEVKVYESEDLNGKYLAIVNESETFTLKDYYKTLEQNGWDCVTAYSGAHVQYKGSNIYVELTKTENNVGYEIMYYHLTDLDLEENGYKSSYNILVCHNNYSFKARDEASWSENDLSVIKYVSSTDLPYIALGEDYGISAEDANTLTMYDYYVNDLSKQYSDILQNDGFTLEEGKCNINNVYYLSKTLDDGAKLDIVIRYFNGNNIYVYYTPYVVTSSSWPSDIIQAFYEATLVTIPEFPIADDGVYYIYSKNDIYYIIAYDLDDEFDYYGYATTVKSELFAWNEYLSINAYIISEDYETYDGFYIAFSESAPTSDFTETWPKDDINDTLKNVLNAEGVEVPEIDISSFNLNYDIKYHVGTKEEWQEAYDYYLDAFTRSYGDAYDEETLISMAKQYADRDVKIGMTIEVYDHELDKQIDYVVRYKVNEAYKKALYNAGWYCVPDSANCTYEDPTGKVSITVSNTPYDVSGYTSITITEGSGVAHTPTFAFSKENYDIANGRSVTLNLSVNMLPYDITYESSDTSGKVTVDQTGKVTVAEDATIGEQVTITASCTDKDGVKHSTSCTVTVIQNYNYKVVISEIQALLKAEGYNEDSYTLDDVYAAGSTTKIVGKSLKLNFGTSKTKAEVKALAKDKLLPTGFIASRWTSSSDYDSFIDNPFSGNITKKSLSPLGKSIGTSDAEYLYCYKTTDYSRLSIYYYVWTESNGDIILYIEARG